MAGRVLFNEGGLKIEEGGQEIFISVTRADRASMTIALIEGHARHAGLALRKWVRDRKELRGDTPRGRAAAERRRQRAESDANVAVLRGSSL